MISVCSGGGSDVLAISAILCQLLLFGPSESLVTTIGPIFSTNIDAMLEYPGPPASQIIQGSVETVSVREPLVFSKPQKKAVLFVLPTVCVEMLPAQLRGKGHITFSRGSVTSKSMWPR